MGGLFKKIKDRITGDDDQRQEERREEQSHDTGRPDDATATGRTGGGSAIQSDAGVTSTMNDIVARADASVAGSVPSPLSPADAAMASPAASATPSSAEGSIKGTGLERTYTTRGGDTLEAIATYFYGDPIHKQRLIDDNPSLQPYDGKEMPANTEIKVGEDAGRGDTVARA